MSLLSNISEEVIKKILLSLDSSKATRMDQIPAKFMRDGAKVLALPLRNNKFINKIIYLPRGV